MYIAVFIHRPSSALEMNKISHFKRNAKGTGNFSSSFPKLASGTDYPLGKDMSSQSFQRSVSFALSRVSWAFWSTMPLTAPMHGTPKSQQCKQWNPGKGDLFNDLFDKHWEFPTMLLGTPDEPAIHSASTGQIWTHIQIAATALWLVNYLEKCRSWHRIF